MSSDITRDNHLRPLQCVAQSYAWGKLGSTSLVARMKESSCGNGKDENWKLESDQPYAELWLGTHPNGMSTVVHHEPKASSSSNGGSAPAKQRMSLLDHVRSDSFLHCGDEDETDLTFLLKILSVRKVLSIQAHPDKALAEKLHAAKPTVYKDPNHKPEMALAVTTVRAMMGFRPFQELVQNVADTPELVAAVGADIVAELQAVNGNLDHRRSVLQKFFQTYLQVPADTMKGYVEQAVQRLESLSSRNEVQELMLQLQQQFPGDCGVFAPLLLNVCELQPGQALFIGANEPHAYISGDMVECMACSDNVVRAGLTPKLKDVPTLVDMLTYDCRRPELTEGVNVDACTKRYQPPVSDFCMEVVTVPAGQVYELQAVSSPKVMLTLEGDATLSQDGEDVKIQQAVSFGSAVFLSAKTHCTVTAGPSGVKLTRAFTNVFYEDRN